MTELYIGASKGFAYDLMQRRRSLGHRVICVTGSSVEDHDSIQVDWNKMDSSDIFKICKELPEIDFLFFNQKASALSSQSFCRGHYDTLELWKQSKYWNHCYFMSCILPFEFIHNLGSKLSDSSKVCWMLSGMILEHKNDPQYADYIGQKFQNYMLMKNFALNHDSCFFAINPGNISSQDYTAKLEHFDRICSKEQQDLNGKVWRLDSLEPDDITSKLG